MARRLSAHEVQVLAELRRAPEACLPDLVARVYGERYAPRVRQAIDGLRVKGKIVRTGRGWRPAED